MAQPAPAVLSEQGRRQQVAATVAASHDPGPGGGADVGEVCVVPIAFVSDHVETLGEIDHEAREEAAALESNSLR